MEDRLAILRQRLGELKQLHFSKNSNSATSTKRKQPDKSDDTWQNDMTFLDFFAGEAGLTKAVMRAGVAVLQAHDIHGNGLNEKTFDLTKTEPFKQSKKLLRTNKVRWLHLAPPCKTFSRARRKDRFAAVRKLRSKAKPQGLDPKPKVVREANLLASRSARWQHYS